MSYIFDPDRRYDNELTKLKECRKTDQTIHTGSARIVSPASPMGFTKAVDQFSIEPFDHAPFKKFIKRIVS